GCGRLARTAAAALRRRRPGYPAALSIIAARSRDRSVSGSSGIEVVVAPRPFRPLGGAVPKSPSARFAFRFRRVVGGRPVQLPLSDKGKFRFPLNGPKRTEMSEFALISWRRLGPSKLMTRVRFPSPAPIFRLSPSAGSIVGNLVVTL